MIRKLRVKFILTAMLSVFAVLFSIMGIINFLNYRNVVKEADKVLSVLKENDGTFPKGSSSAKPENRKENVPKDMSPEVPFESRFFSVLLNGNGFATSVDTGKIAAVDTETAIAYAESLWASSRQSGFIAHYRYVKQITDDGMRIIFLDCGRNLTTFRSFLIISILVSILGFISVFILVVLASKKITKPVMESYEKQKRFITDAGHEIKTPLTIIDADASVLELEYGENEWIQDIQKQTQRLTGLTNNLIYLARMEEENNPLQMIDFPLSDVLAETVQSFLSLARVQCKSIASHIEPMLSFHGDEKAIRQLISILLENALKYSAETGKITVTADKRGKNIYIRVSNTVAFITPEQLHHLFDRFYRTDQSRNAQTGGYGIGLSIARAIVLAHKGKITASSLDGRTLTITIVL